MRILNHIKERSQKGDKMLALLIDPDRFRSIEELDPLIEILKQAPPDFVLVGGSLINNDFFDSTVKKLKNKLTLPILIFPGNNTQISSDADGILLLSLISGRNSDYLIGQHVTSSFALKRSNVEILSTGYALIDCGNSTSAQYMSNTTPIPYAKNGIAAATILAGEQLGMSLFYLDGGSGADKPISISMIRAIRSTISSPLIVGGGLKTKLDVENAWGAGANIVVVGTAFENKASFISELR